MAYPSVTYTFTNSTTADATQVNQNFTDIINGVSDGTKDININLLTAGSTSTLNGNVTVGNASSKDLVINASLASTIAIKTTQTYDIGGSTIGLRSLYLGDAGSAARATRLIGATISAGWTMTLPTGAGTNTYVMQTDGAGATSWSSRTVETFSASKTGAYTATASDDLVQGSASGGAFTITLPSAGSNSGKILKFLKTDSSTNAITVSRAGADTINGATTAKLSTQYELLTLVSDGSATWYVLARTFPSKWKSDNTIITPGSTPWGTISAQSTYWRRVGDSIHIHLIFTAGTTTANAATLALASGYQIDTNKLITTTNTSQVGIYWRGYASETQVFPGDNAGVLFFDGTDGATLFVGGSWNASTQFNKDNANSSFISGRVFVGEMTYPVSGWES